MIKNAIIKASTIYAPAQIDAFNKALLHEKKLANENAIWALEAMIKNEEIARKSKLPLCDDTGIPHVLIELGRKRQLPENFIEKIKEGIKEGLDNLPARPMAVKGSELIRLEQSEGLYDKPSMIETAPISIDSFDKNHIDYSIDLLREGLNYLGKRNYKTSGTLDVTAKYKGAHGEHYPGFFNYLFETNLENGIYTVSIGNKDGYVTKQYELELFELVQNLKEVNTT